MFSSSWSGALSVLLLAGNSQAIDLDISNSASIIAASKIVAGQVLQYYPNPREPGSTPGLFPQPYYWWESGAAWDSLINYWALSGDDSVGDTITEALLFQVGPDNNYMPPNQTKSLGNDDQSTWALAAMTAAERSLPARQGQNVSWLQLAQNVFDSQAARWDNETCGGGLRWQIFTFNAGYDYKNSQSNGNFMQLAARLAHFTGNASYADWANMTYEWSRSIGLVDSSNGTLHVYDGTDVSEGCANVNHLQFTAGAATYLNAMNYLKNSSQRTTDWSGPSAQLFQAIDMVFSTEPNSPQDGVLTESACASTNNCNIDQLWGRAPLARALANLRDLGSSNITQQVTTILQTSAKGAAAQCSGGDNKTTCGSDWTSSEWDGTQGLGQALSALEILLANLPSRTLATANSTGARTPATGSANGTSNGNVSATTPSSTPSVLPSSGASTVHGFGTLYIAVALAFAVTFCTAI